MLSLKSLLLLLQPLRTNLHFTSKMYTPSGNLYRIDQMPEHFHELFIFSGYRHPKSSLKQCIRSMFELTNETINIWTHFFPAVYYWWVMWSMWGELDMSRDSYCYPMLVYLVTMCLFPTASCVAHIFNTMSDKARHICFFMDYWALSVYSLGGAIAYRAYAFPMNLLNSWFMTLFIPVAIFNSLASCAMSCDTRFLPHGLQKKIFRISAFAVPYWFDVIPVTYRALWGGPLEWASGGLYYHMRQFIFAFLSAFLYTSHIPERLFPGKFDILGHSHQIFHVISVIGTHDQMVAMKADMLERRHLMESHGVVDASFSSFSVYLMLVVGLINVAIVVWFCRKLHYIIKSSSLTDLTKLGGRANASMNGTRLTNGKAECGVIDSSLTNGAASLDEAPPTRTQPHRRVKMDME